MTLDPERVRAEIERILAQAKYGVAPQNPLSDWWNGVWRRFVDWLDRVIAALPGGPEVFFGLLGLLVIGAAVWLALTLAKRRNRQLEARARARYAEEDAIDPAELEAAATRAAAQGDYRESVRLRFVAGLLRLDRKNAIDFRPGMTSAEVSARLREPSYDQLAIRFDAIVYGDAPAGPSDDQSSAEGWRRLLEVV
jgi:hypothetical protein